MEEALKLGGNIYVHCSAGIYRSPQMIALYLIAIKKYNMEEAVNLLKQKHSYAKPSSVVIEEALHQFEGNLLKKKIVA
jgi:protein-tyrosine phosphatase